MTSFNSASARAFGKSVRLPQSLLREFDVRETVELVKTCENKDGRTVRRAGGSFVTSCLGEVSRQEGKSLARSSRSDEFVMGKRDGPKATSTSC